MKKISAVVPLSTIKVLPFNCSRSVITEPSFETTPSATFMYGFAKSTTSLRAGVTVKLARMISTFLESKYSARFAASTKTNSTLFSSPNKSLPIALPISTSKPWLLPCAST